MEAIDILTATVQAKVGSRTASPRHGQARMCMDIAEAMEGRGQLVGVGPTGVGKTFALLATAAHRAVTYRERTVMSTESLTLQSQVLNEDAPAIVNAVVELGGRRLRVAVLKGVNNYVDPARLLRVSRLLAGVGDENEKDLRKLAALVAVAHVSRPVLDDLDGADINVLRPLVIWGLDQYLDGAAPGDRHSYDGPHTDVEWNLISAQSGEAAPEDFVPTPKAKKARSRAADADILVTNHTLLAIQAATGAPIVLGGKKLGSIDHIIVDEAHALAAKVREFGAAELSGAHFTFVISAVEKVGLPRAQVKGWIADGRAIAERMEVILSDRIGRKEELVLSTGDDPLDSIVYSIEEWANAVQALVAKASTAKDEKVAARAARACASAARLNEALDSVADETAGKARWLAKEPEPDNGFELYRRWTLLRSSPVDVAQMIRQNLWSASPTADGDPVRLTAIAVSATLPLGFAAQVGLEAVITEYESPFAAAFVNSALFIPHATTAADVSALSTIVNGRPRFDTGKHAGWAAGHIVDLVHANSGSALVLSASSANGRSYAAELRRTAPDLRIHSQWDGETPARLLAAWRADIGSVLVGTRSLMTGVDAPGETCSLVILDRVPRNRANPVDDARVAELRKEGHDRWDAMRLVYVADAALIAEQAVGRLIRSITDTGMVAVLDPRLLKVRRQRGPFTYSEEDREVYMKPLLRFSTRISDVGVAQAWLAERKFSSAV